MSNSNEPGTALRDILLGGDQHIVVRPVCADDDVMLMDLYEALDAEDRHRRFFCAYRTGLDFYTEMATVADRGGAGLVAVLRGPPPTDERIIGEASYSPLPNGDGELGMVVDRRWRGWLGPYLLDALVDTAAANGVPNLEADVLTENRPMLAILRSRGCVMMEHDRWSEVRLLIGTAGRRPTWPGPHDRERVLVEGAGGHWHAEDAARAAGLQLLACPGPRNGRRDCPVLSGEPCPLAAEADVVVVSHPADDRWRDLLAAHAALHPGVPVCLESAKLPVDDEHVTMCPVAGDSEVVSFVRHLADPERPSSK